MFLRELYVVAYMIIMDNPSFQNDISDNWEFYLLLWVLWPFYLTIAAWVYFFGGAAAFCADDANICKMDWTSMDTQTTII